MTRKSKRRKRHQQAKRRIAARIRGARNFVDDRERLMDSGHEPSDLNHLTSGPGAPQDDSQSRQPQAASNRDLKFFDAIENCEVLANYQPDPGSGRFGEINFGDLLNHARDPLHLLRQARQWLAPGGTLKASFVNARNKTIVGSLLSGEWSTGNPSTGGQTPIRLYTRREIEKLFYRAGLTLHELRVEETPDLQRWRSESRVAEIVVGSLQISAPSSEEAEEFHAERFLAMALAPAMLTKQPDYGLTSIVIVTCNQLEYTRQCLESIRFHTDEQYELIFVDNGSTDGTVEYLRSAADVRLIENADNRGFPAAANQGILASHGRQILLLNNDVLVTTGWLDRMLRALHSDPQVGLVGPCSNAVSGSQQVPVSYDDLASLDGFAWDWGHRHDSQRDEVRRLVGFCLLFRRELTDQIGVLDERFGIGNFEDDDLCLRARHSGYRSVIARDAFIHHFGHRTFAGNGVDLNALLLKNEQIFQEKWQGQAISHSLSVVGGEQRSNDHSSHLLSPDPRLDASYGHHSPIRCKLSCCMIVRNNEPTIGAAVESVLPWVDEVIVLDTGSTDKTPEICRRLGCRVYHFPWPDSFSIARNESLKYARGEWIFWMDSDDVIDAENGRKLAELIRGFIDPKILGFTMQVHCPTPDRDGDFDATIVDHCKIFRNRPDLGFEGRIHEQVLGSISRAGGEVAYTPLFVVHAGADHTPQGRRRKLARDFKLLRLELREQPGHTFTLFNLGMTFADAKKYRQAVRVLKRSLAAADPGETHVRKIYALLVSSLKELGCKEEAMQYCQEGLALFSKDPELHFRSGILHHDAGRLRQAEQAYLAALANDDELHFASLDRGITGYKARQNLAVVYGDMGAPHKSEEQWRRITEEVPGYRYAWQCLADNLLEQGEWGAAEALAAQLLRSPELRATGLVLAAQLAERRGDLPLARQLLVEGVEQCQGDERPLEELCRLLFHHASPEDAEAALVRLVREKPDDAAAQHNLAAVYLRQGRYAEAISLLENSLRLRPNSETTEHLLDSAQAALAR